MASADELLVVHGQQRAGGGQELGVENNLMHKRNAVRKKIAIIRCRLRYSIDKRIGGFILYLKLLCLTRRLFVYVYNKEAAIKSCCGP